MFRSLSFVGVASAAIIESRPHEHLQMANAQLQNATEAVIKTAAVAGLAYAGAYMAAAGTTPGAYDSSRRSQASSTGQRYCDTREQDGSKYKCTADYFNGVSVDNADASQTKVAVRNYWCCPAQDLGGKYIGEMNGVCVSENTGVSVFASSEPGKGGCVYHGPCTSGTNAFTPALKSIAASGGENKNGVGQCSSILNNLDAAGLAALSSDALREETLSAGIFGGSPGGYITSGAVDGPGGQYLGASSGRAYNNGLFADVCCQKSGNTIQVYDMIPATLDQPVTFCSVAKTCPSGYFSS